MSKASIARRLKEKGLKVTEARVSILTMLEIGGVHLSADDIKLHLAKKGQDVGIATVYRTLTQLEEAGLIQKHHFSDKKAWYEACDRAHHDHMVCEDCGKVIEFCDDVIEERQLIVAKEHGFEVRSHQLILFGVCQDCASKSA